MFDVYTDDKMIDKKLDAKTLKHPTHRRADRVRPSVRYPRRALKPTIAAGASGDGDSPLIPEDGGHIAAASAFGGRVGIQP